MPVTPVGQVYCRLHGGGAPSIPNPVAEPISALWLTTPAIGTDDPRNGPMRGQSADSRFMNSRPNILILVCDAARAENFSVLGYDRPTTPNLQRWADRLALYDQCISAAMWTLPSTSSLFTGTYPSRHGLVIDGDRLSRQFITLPEWLRSAGYLTAKVTGQVPYVSDFTGLDRGFDHQYEAPVDKWRQMWRSWRRRLRGKSGGGQTHIGVDLGLDLKAESDAAKRKTISNRMRYWLTGFADCGAAACCDEVRRLWQTHTDQPKCVYVHMQETHAEYRPLHRYRKRFLPDDLRSANLAQINQRPNPHDVGLVQMTPDDYRALTALYDGCIAYLDEQIGRLLDDLAKTPDFDDTLVIVTADHGDCLGRHGILGHQFVLYDDLIRIPWLVKYPKNAAASGLNHALIQNVDLISTLGPMLNLDTPAQCEGINVLADSRDLAYAELLKPFGGSAIRQGLPAQAPQYDRAVLAVRSATHKFIEHSNQAPAELYDLSADPHETTNLLADPSADNDQPGVQAVLDGAKSWRLRWADAAKRVQDRLQGEDAQAQIAPEVEERLRALGYLD